MRLVVYREEAEKKKSVIIAAAVKLVKGGAYKNAGVSFGQALKAKWPVEVKEMDEETAALLDSAVTSAMEKGYNLASIVKHVKGGSSKKLAKLAKDFNLSQIRSLLAIMEKQGK